MKFSTVTVVSFFSVLTADIVNRINTFIGVSNGSTELVFLLNLVSIIGLFFLIKRTKIRKNTPRFALYAFQAYMLWGAVSFVRGGFNAENYWDWKALLLSYSFSIAVPLFIIFGISQSSFLAVFRFVVRRVFLFGFVVVPYSLIADHELYPRVVTAICFFILFIPYLRFRWQVLVVGVAVASILMDMAYRINVLRILFPTALVFMFFAMRGRYWLSRSAMNAFACFALCAPLLFLALGVTGQFNVFADSDSSVFDVNVFEVGGAEGATVAESNLSADTRTLLYVEVFNSMNKKDSSFLIGEGGGTGYLTDLFADADLSGRGRGGSEVGFLNTVLYSGGVGVFLYALVLFVPALYAINRSNNTLCKMIGLWLVFRWIVFFVEDISSYSMNMIFLWLAVGLCMSISFRAMSDSEIKNLLVFRWLGK